MVFTLLQWKQFPLFLNTLEGACKLKSGLSKQDAEDMADRNAAYTMANVINISETSRHDRDKLTAATIVLKAAGIGVGGPSINVQVNVDQSAKAYMSSQQEDTPNT